MPNKLSKFWQELKRRKVVRVQNLEILSCRDAGRSLIPKRYYRFGKPEQECVAWPFLQGNSNLSAWILPDGQGIIDS